ncbi:MAG: 3-methyl-2-oxobutanoate hydroxymethyltransferase [Coriobacteriia bacterium]|nr:3-methyl-2-oxobutanoate hydroxymethyltransferase [Coriobacteriia bacterium]
MDPPHAVTTTALRAMKSAQRPIVMITAYDTPSARLVEEAGVDVILVGDSLGMTVLGFDSTLPVTVDDMVRHTAAVTRATKRALVVADMPFMSFQVSEEDALRAAGRLVVEGGAAAIKLEGGAHVAPTVHRLVQAGIPVMAHVGLTPQSVHQLGGYKVQAKEADAAATLIDDCLALEEAGAFAIVLECIPAELATLVSQQLAVPAIGIGAGEGCDGQVQVLHDLIGLGGEFLPHHAKRYADTGALVREAVTAYADDVRGHAFPTEEQTTHMDAGTLEAVRSARARLRRVGGSGTEA